MLFAAQPARETGEELRSRLGLVARSFDLLLAHYKEDAARPDRTVRKKAGAGTPRPGVGGSAARVETLRVACSPAQALRASNQVVRAENPVGWAGNQVSWTSESIVGMASWGGAPNAGRTRPPPTEAELLLRCTTGMDPTSQTSLSLPAPPWLSCSSTRIQFFFPHGTRRV